MTDDTVETALAAGREAVWAAPVARTAEIADLSALTAIRALFTRREIQDAIAAIERFQDQHDDTAPDTLESFRLKLEALRDA